MKIIDWKQFNYRLILMVFIGIVYITICYCNSDSILKIINEAFSKNYNIYSKAFAGVVILPLIILASLYISIGTDKLGKVNGYQFLDSKIIIQAKQLIEIETSKITEIILVKKTIKPSKLKSSFPK